MKRNWFPQEPASQAHFGLVGWLEATRVSLPLKGVECRFEVTGRVASVELDQVYYQNAGRALDCSYTFPLPAGAAVYRCELHVNGRVIRAKVEEKTAAKRIFREQKSAGRRAALVETEREDLFTLSLGNVQPEDLIVVRFAWFQTLDRTGDSLRLLVPTCPGVRYVPGKPLLRGSSGGGTVDDTDQVPDASRISPPRIDELHPDCAYVSMKGRLTASEVRHESLSSSSHAICFRDRGEDLAVELSGGTAIPDHDFVLSWQEPEAPQLEPQAWHWKDAEGTYALVQLRAPEVVEVAEGVSQDVYFLVDRSGSMAGAKWHRTCEALQAFVGLLGPEDRVWITLFESTYRDFAEAPMKAPLVLADRGFQKMEAIGTVGGTELLPAVNHVLAQIEKHSSERQAVLVLITDGQVGNEAAILNAFKSVDGATVHTFGIDTTVNDAFLKSLARQQRGGCWLQTPDDDFAGTIAALAARLRRPVLTDLAIWGSWEMAGEALPDLHAGEVVTVSVRQTAAAPIEISGRLPDGREHRYAVGSTASGGEAIKLLWVRERMTTLLATGEQGKAVALGREHNLLCEGAAFIAWDEAEQVQIASVILVQPAMQPSTKPKFFFEKAADAYSDDSTFGDLCVSEALSGLQSRGAFKMRSAQVVAGSMRPVVTRRYFGRGGVLQRKFKSFFAYLRRDHKVASRRVKMAPPPEKSLLFAKSFARTLREGGLPRRSQSALERGLEDARHLPAEKFIEWSYATAKGYSELPKLRILLEGAAVPEDIADCLLAWVLGRGTIDSSRMSALRKFLDSLTRLPFRAGAAASHWRGFIAGRLGMDSEALTLAARWLGEG